MQITKLTDRKIVKQSNSLNTAQYSLSALAIDILQVFLAQILQEDTKSNSYMIKVSDLENKLGRRLNKKYLDKATDEIMGNFIKLKKDGEILKLNWASSCRLTNNMIEFKTSNEIEEFVMNLKNHFVQVNYTEVAKLKTFYSKRLYMLLMQYRSTGYYTININDLKYIFDLENNKSYDNYYDFKKRIITPSMKQINESTTISVDLNEVKEGRKTVRLEFFIKNNKKEEESIDFKKEVEDLVNFFHERINEKEIATVKIKSRIKELLEVDNYTSEDLKLVASHFQNKWIEDPDFSKFITMKTLFNEKFDMRLTEAKEFKKDYNEYYEVIETVTNKFSNLIQSKSSDIPFDIVEKIIFWSKRYSKADIVETIEKTVDLWNKNPKIAKYATLSKILDSKFPERYNVVKNSDSKQHASGVNAIEEWLQKQNEVVQESEIIDIPL